MTTRIRLEDIRDRYAFCDPSGKNNASGTKRAQARTAIVVVGFEHTLHRCFVLETWVGKLTAPKLQDKIIDMAVKWQPRQFGIEANAMQELFAAQVREAARLRDVHIPMIPVSQSTKVEKDFRIRTVLQPLWGDGRLFIGPKQFDLEAELTGFPLYKTKDIVDALASAIAMAPKKMQKQQRLSEAEQLRAYLKATGASEYQIRNRLAEVGLGD